MTFLRKSISLVAVWLKSVSICSMMFLLLWYQKLWNRFCHNTFIMLRSCIKISHVVVLGIPRSVSGSHTVIHQSWFIAPIHVQHSQVFCLFRASTVWITFNRFLTIFEAFAAHFYGTALSALFPKAIWIIWIFSTEECSSLTQNLMQIHCSTPSVILNAMATQ